MQKRGIWRECCELGSRPPSQHPVPALPAFCCVLCTCGVFTGHFIYLTCLWVALPLECEFYEGRNDLHHGVKCHTFMFSQRPWLLPPRQSCCGRSSVHGSAYSLAVSHSGQDPGLLNPCVSPLHLGPWLGLSTYMLWGESMQVTQRGENEAGEDAGGGQDSGHGGRVCHRQGLGC